MKNSTQVLVFFSCLICRLGNDSFAFALSMSASGHSSGRRSFISKAATSAGVIGTTSSLSWFNPAIPGNGDHSNTCACAECSGGDHSNTCACAECSGIFGMKPANAIEEKQIVDDGKTEKRNMIEYAFEKQALETNARLAKGGFPLDTKEEEEARIQEGLASYSYDAAVGGKKGTKYVSKGYGKNR